MGSNLRPGISAARALGDRRASPDRRWIVALTGKSPAAVDGWLAETDAFVGLEARIRKAHRAGGRDSYAQFRAPLELYALVRALRPRLVVETGVSSGVSSAHLLLGLRANGSGRLVSIDLPTLQKTEKLARGESIVSIPPGRSSGWAIPEELRDGWELKLGPSQKLLPALAKRERRIDLFLHDDLHTPEHLAFELRTLTPRFADGAVVLADNTRWTGTAFDEFAARHGHPVLRRRGSDLVGLRWG